MRKRTGLHNRFRHGKGTYSNKKKHLDADSFGTYQQGKQITPERIAGRTISKPIPSMDRKDRGNG